MTFFISYTTRTEQDVKWAMWLEAVLRLEFGAKTIIQMYDFMVGDNFRANMDDALKEVANDPDGGAVVCIVSEAYQQSANCREEWTNAKRIIPIRIDDAAIEGLLKSRVYIDLHKLGEEKAKVKLIEEIKGLDRPDEIPPFPGKAGSAATPVAQPTMHNLPTRNPDFTGRETQLSKLEKLFQTNAIVSLIGLGGKGKTAVALEYAHRYMADYALIWSFNAASETTLQADYRTFAARVLGEQDPTIPFSALKDKIDAWLSRQTSCLLIYDNAEGYADKLYAFLPRGLRGAHVLICSREAIAGVRAKLEQEMFSPDDAVAFVQKRIPAATRDEAKTLAKELGYFPLALECAVAYISENAYSINQYVSEFKQSKLEVLDDNPHEQSKTIRTIWLSTFAKLEEQARSDKLAEAAAQLLGLCAYCAPDDIPLQLFIDGRECLPEPLQSALTQENKPAQNKVLAHLIRYSLISLSRDEGGNALLSMHRLLQEAAIDSIQPSVEAIAYDLLVVREVVIVYEYATPAEFSAFTHNAPHFAEIAQHAEILLVDTEQQELVGWIYNALGYGCDKLGNYNTALEWLKKSLAIRERVLDTEHPATATSYNNIAYVYARKGDYDTALVWYKKSLAIRERVLGTEHPDTAATYNNIAGVYAHKGDHDTALKWLMKASGNR